MKLLHPVLPIQDIYTTAATDLGIPVGTSVVGPWGNIYRWVKTKSTITGAGIQLMQPVAATAGSCLLITDLTAAGSGQGADPFITDNTTTTQDAGALAGAALYVSGGTGIGQLGQVKSHPAYAAAAPSANATGIRLVQPLVTAVNDTTTDVAIIKPWVLDVIATSGTTVKCRGVSIQAMTDEYYGFVLVKGYGLVLVQGTTTVAAQNNLVPGAGTTAGTALVDTGTYAANSNRFATVIVAPATGTEACHFCWVYCE